MSFHQLFRNSINMSQKCLKYPVCNKHNSKSNIVNFINIFSDPNIISSTRSTEIVSESDSSPLQEHATLRKRKRRRHIDLDGARNPSSKKKLKFMPTSKSGMTVSADHGWQKKGFDSLTGSVFILLPLIGDNLTSFSLEGLEFYVHKSL